MRLWPFIEWRPNEVGIGISLSFDRETIHSLEPGDKSSERVWIPNIWIHLGPIVAGVGIRFGGES